MGWTANAPVIAQHEVKALREMVGSAYNGRLNLARSSSSMSNLPWSTARSCIHCPTRWPTRVGRVLATMIPSFIGDRLLLQGHPICWLRESVADGRKVEARGINLPRLSERPLTFLNELSRKLVPTSRRLSGPCLSLGGHCAPKPRLSISQSGRRRE